MFQIGTESMPLDLFCHYIGQGILPRCRSASIAAQGWVMARVYLNLKCAEDNEYHFQMAGEFHAPCAYRRRSMQQPCHRGVGSAELGGHYSVNFPDFKQKLGTTAGAVVRRYAPQHLDAPTLITL